MALGRNSIAVWGQCFVQGRIPASGNSAGRGGSVAFRGKNKTNYADAGGFGFVDAALARMSSIFFAASGVICRTGAPGSRSGSSAWWMNVMYFRCRDHGQTQPRDHTVTSKSSAFHVMQAPVSHHFDLLLGEPGDLEQPRCNHRHCGAGSASAPTQHTDPHACSAPMRYVRNL